MADGPEIEFSVAVRKDGRAQFESKVIVPLLNRSEEQVKSAAEAWMDMMVAGLRVSQSLRKEEDGARG